jgi:hypothetical protein
MNNNESLLNSEFELEKISRKTTFTQQELIDHHPFGLRNPAVEFNKDKNMANSKRPLLTNTSERDDMSSNFNNLMQNNDDFNNISGLLCDVNASLFSYHQNTKKNVNNLVISKEEEDQFEINQPRKAGAKLILDLSKSEGRSLEYFNNSNIKSPGLNLEITSTQDHINSSKLHNTKPADKKEEVKTDKFFFSFDKDAHYENKSKRNTDKTSREASTVVETDKKKYEENIGNPIFTVKKKKNAYKKEINIIEAILNTQNEFQVNEDVEINQTSFNNNISYVRNFPFSNTNPHNSIILLNSHLENEDKYSPNNLNKTTTAFSRQSDHIPFLENQMQKELNSKKENMKMREIIQSFSEDDNKVMQIEDTKQFSDSPCDTCGKQCLIF